MFRYIIFLAALAIAAASACILLIWAAVWIFWAIPAWAKTAVVAIACAYALYRIGRRILAKPLDDDPVVFSIDDEDYLRDYDEN